MDTVNGSVQTVAPEGMPQAQLDQIVATAISTDGTMALIRFKDPHGKEVLLTMTVEKLASLQHLCAQMRQRLNRKTLPVDQVVMQFPQSWMVGSSDQQRNVVGITFDEKLPSEAMYVLTDEAGLNLADALQQNIFSRMSPAERHAYQQRKHPLLLPLGAGRIMRP